MVQNDSSRSGLTGVGSGAPSGASAFLALPAKRFRD